MSSWEGAQRLINTAVETFGDLHIVVNNAGILRDRVLVNMTEEEWDAVINVHLKGTFAPSRWAAAYWREQSKAGKPVSGRIINTTSVSGIYGNPGQTNYGAAKAGMPGRAMAANPVAQTPRREILPTLPPLIFLSIRSVPRFSSHGNCLHAG